MIFEYAVEPELAATWHEPREGRYFIEKFSPSQGRLVSRYPETWKLLVWKAFRGSKDIERKRMEELLARIGEKMVPRRGKFHGNLGWLENAEREHARCAFRAILARSSPRQNPRVLVADALNEASEPLWAVEVSVAVPREPTDLATAIAPMMRCSSEIIFVDPYFRVRGRFVRTLKAFLAAAFRERPGDLPKRIEIHAKYDSEATQFETECNMSLPRVIPRGAVVRVIRWRERSGSEKLHNRFVLTDIGGVEFGIGLDDSGRSSGQNEDINLLGRGQYALRWKQFASDPPAFEMVGKPLSIVGSAR